MERLSVRPSCRRPCRQSPRVFNAVGNAARQLQRCCCQPPDSTRRCHRVSTAVNGATARIHTVRCILTVTSTAGWKGGLLLAEHRLLILIIDHRFYERTSINQCLFNIPTKGNNSHNSNTIHNLNPDPTLPLTV